jgi:microsomal dipeptidase-like Zn-dependent dipeptidase
MSNHIPIVDLHCHSVMKPYGKSFGGPAKRANLWFRDRPGLWEKAQNKVAKLTRFTQADMTSLAMGNVRVVFVALYPLEKGFVINKQGQGGLSDLGLDGATGLGPARLNHLQAMADYFTDLESEYKFLCDGAGGSHTVDGHGWSYRLVSSMAEVDAALLESPTIICVVPTIEGAQVFNSGLLSMGRVANEAELLGNVRKVKQWPHPPFFMTFAHHFDNELCGHALAFDQGIQRQQLDQSVKLGEGFAPLGWKVLEEMLRTDNGRRILIDIKHMSPLARRQYSARALQDNIPLIVSHGAVNGTASMDDPRHLNQPTAGRFSATGLMPEQGSRFPVSINFYDDEILAIARSQGIFGMQMDERRIGSDLWLRRAADRVERRKALFYSSQLIWNQIQHMAEVLDTQGLSAWDIQAIGTDHDGIVDPPNGYWSAVDLNELDDYLLMHAHNYLRNGGNTLRNTFNSGIDPELLVDKVMHGNAMAFMRRWFV